MCPIIFSTEDFIFYTAFYVMNFLYYEYKPIKEE